MKKSIQALSNLYSTPIFFCGRDNETKFIQKRIKKKSNVQLISKDGIGKTALVSHTLNQLISNNQYSSVMIDLMFFTTFRSFLIYYVNSLLNFISHKKPSDNSEYQLDEIHHLSEIDLLKKLSQIFGIINEGKNKTLIALDNCQYSVDYGHEKFETYILNPIIHSENVSLVMTGNTKPYSLDNTEVLILEKIDENEYQKFVMSILKKKGLSIGKKTLSKVIDWSGAEIPALEAIFIKIWQSRTKKIKIKDLNKIIAQIMMEKESEFAIVKNLLSPYQWKLLLSIASQNEFYRVTSSNFISQYELNAPSSVKTALDALVEKELIVKESKTYKLTNRLFKNWIVQHLQSNNIFNS